MGESKSQKIKRNAIRIIRELEEELYHDEAKRQRAHENQRLLVQAMILKEVVRRLEENL